MEADDDEEEEAEEQKEKLVDLSNMLHAGEVKEHIRRWITIYFKDL